MSNTANLVSQYLIQTLRQQIQEHHIVVWFDPEKQYQALVRAENFPNVQLFSYEPQKGFMALRRELEQVWGTFEPPQLLIYVPTSEDFSNHALVEYTTAGVTVQPGEQPVERNSRLAIVARQALNGILPANNLSKVISEVENGQLSLSELDEIASRHKEIHIGALALIFKSENIEDICLQFLASKNFDEDIRTKNAITTLIALLKNELEIQLSEKDELGKVRESLARYLLFAEFASHLGKSLPASLSTFKGPKSKGAYETVLRLVRQWRLRSDTTASYIEAANKFEPEIDLSKHVWTIEMLDHADTFAGIEDILQSLVEKALIEKPVQDLVEIARKRQNGFWPNQIPTLKLHWQMIVEAGQVLVQSNAIKTALKQEWSASQLVKNYTGYQIHASDGQSPWCKLDTTFRRMERDEHSFDFETEHHDSLQKLLASARSSYIDVIHRMTERFIEGYEKASFHLPEIVQQANIFHDFVQPSLESGKIAYILVDSFRYEMALDLFEQIQTDWDCQVLPALATVPTITEVGMAALMPDAEKGISFSPVGAGKLGVEILKTMLKGRPDRVKYIETNHPQSIVLELNQIAPLKDKKIVNALANAKLAVITATDEIDGLWESQPEIARRIHDDVFNQLRRCIRNLLNVNYQTVIITSDHGFIAGDNLMVGTPMDPPGGDTVDLHRRVWIGHGGANVSTCLRKPVSAFGIGGDLELVTPIGLGCFKAPGGSTQYFHGGMSLQEIIIPILSVRPGKNYLSSNKEPAFHWEVILGSKQISTRFFSVTINGNATELLATPPKIRVELKSGNHVLSMPVAATYGLDETTKDVKMKIEEGSTTLIPNTVTLFIDDIPAGTVTVDLDLINSETGLALTQVQNIPIAFSL
ncbi:protein containing PglZ domain [Anaerolinea thermolimosa]|uniref:PglZ domain-containing protein n=1 Tax=Anaerolinea thermolimosa TaxID=229919 RepID=UPI0007850917|nr:PglZ domain-containing protein [Anaerolinea thermolimosa]GAP06026.1 protein containing PglZ domain [Anaerolinea thermolimosa]